MKKIFLNLSFLCFVGLSHAQYNTISGTVWLEADGTPNGLRDGSESLVTGVLASLIETSSGLEVASGVSDMNGLFELKNFTGAGTYRIDFYYPGEGYTITAERIGSDNTINSSVDPSGAFNSAVSSADFVISSTNNINTYGLGLVRVTNTITHYVSKPSTATDWSQTFVLPKSDNSVFGPANRAVIFATNSSFYPLLGIENTSTSAGSPTASISSNGALKLTLPTVPQLEINANSPTKNANLAVYDGNTDYAGTSGISFTNESGSGTAQRAYTSVSDLNAYFRSAGPGSFNVPATVTRTSTFSGGGNLQAVSQANSSAGLFVTYRYPTPVTLPISLVSFTAKKNAEKVLVQWKVGLLQIGTNFIIERSQDGRNYIEIGSVSSSSMNADQSFQFVDTKPLAGKNIYRLKQVDLSGEANYSSSALVTFAKGNNLIVYPNPANAFLTVETETTSKILLFNAAGQNVTVPVSRNTNQAVLATGNLQPGVYTLRVIEGAEAKSRQVIVQHP